MKRMFKILGLTFVTVAMMAIVCAGTVSAVSGPLGPAPNSGDGIPDGSGLEIPGGPKSETGSGSGLVGPAPNSGDGIPDGSGF